MLNWRLSPPLRPVDEGRRGRGRVASLPNGRPSVYHAEIHKRAMEAALPFGGRCKVGVPAMLQQAGAGGKYRIERQARLLQRNGAKKSDIEVRPRSGSSAVRADVQRLYRIKCAERAARIVGQVELPINPLRHDGLMVPVVHDENRTFWKIRRQRKLDPFPA